MTKWCDYNNFFFWPRPSIIHPRPSVTHVVSSSLIWSSYVKRKITNVNNATWTTIFNAHQWTRTYVLLKDIKNLKFACLFSVLPKPRVDIIHVTNHFWLLEIQKRKYLFISHILIILLLSCNPIILETLNLVLTQSLIFLFLAFSEDRRSCFDINRSAMPLLASADAPLARRLCKLYFSGFAVISVIQSFKTFLIIE